jgi:MFS transporter, FSR family, fosmidomycin resistance protein
MKKHYAQALNWGIIHGLNDLVAGYMLASYAMDHSSSDAVFMLVIYGIIGFGGQLPLALFVDRLKTIAPFAHASLLILFLSVCFYFVDPMIGIVLTGFAGAGVHVVGGTICLQSDDRTNSLIGLFAAPGVLGLTIGGLLSGIAVNPLLAVLILLPVVGASTMRAGIPNYQVGMKKQSSGLDTHDWIMLSILLFMCFRSLIFDLVNLAADKYPNGLLVLGVSAFLGKLFGAFAVERFGWRKTVYVSLILSFLFLHLGKDNIYFLGFAIACLQSSVPIMLVMLSNALSAYPATATALSLGTSVAIAGLPLFAFQQKQLLYSTSVWEIGVIILCIVFTLLLFIRRGCKEIITRQKVTI